MEKGKKLFDLDEKVLSPDDNKVIRKIYQKVGKASKTYGLIEDGDRILVGFSGGKDSLALVEALGERMKIHKPRFEVVAVHITMENIPYEVDLDYLDQFAGRYNIPFYQHAVNFNPETDGRKSPCFLCSWTRRKALFDMARKYDCNKIALGHHMDDMVETLMMNVAFQGALSGMPPLLKMDKFDMTIIRPLALCQEKDILKLAALRGYKRTVKLCPYEKDSYRSNIKELIAKLEELNPHVRQSIWGSMENIKMDYLPRKIKAEEPSRTPN